jgi:hypothetical protein
MPSLAVVASCLSRGEASYRLGERACHRAVASFRLEVGAAVGDHQTKLLRVEEGVEEGDHPLSCHLEEGEEEEVDAYLMEVVEEVVEVAFLPLLPFQEVAEAEEVAQKLPSGAEH